MSAVDDTGRRRDGEGPALLCIACSRQIEQAGLARCVVHSCCSRVVCETCLRARPRLATFCVLCEGAQHALRRKGPREDVIRAGQVVFDFDRIEREEEHISILDQSTPPPAYADLTSEKEYHQGTFVLTDNDDEGEGEDQLVVVETRAERDSGRMQEPSLIDANRWSGKHAVLESKVDASHAVTAKDGRLMDAAAAASSSLRDALEKQDRQRTPPPFSSHASDRASDARSIAKTDDAQDGSDNLTRQYWLRPNDSLMSLSLRFRVNANVLCKLNDLPPSTISSTPHLIHTRRFVLIPENAVKTVLASSSAGNDETLALALQGPAPMTKAQKVQRARREAQSKFRALVSHHDGQARSSKTSHGSALAGVDITPCDERATRAYIALMEEELRLIDFGDGYDECEPSKKEIVADDEALVDAARQRRFDAIIKQAVCRWEMDSEWERKQRSMGLEPESKGLSGSGPSKPSVRTRSWFDWMTSPESVQPKSSFTWVEKGR